ncbi:heavy-metal-associated domain-containing protein [Granulicatella elegans]|nr:heavy metal-associated domain-containing protein [Granulicatella elegans]UEA31832.1 heavy-metal-associated domain-containing protein [Granulicatella elegans]
MIKEFKVEGLKCSGCAKAVENAASAVEGVEKASIDFEAKKLTVQFLQAKVDEKRIIEAVSKAGYQAEIV